LHTGPSILAYGDNTEGVVDALVKQVEEQKAAFLSQLYTPAEALHKAQELAGDAPVIIVDTYDNPGAGAYSDDMALFQAMVAHGVSGVIACVYDLKAADKAQEQQEITIKLGNDGVERIYQVLKTGDGNFAGTGPMYGGNQMQLGNMALLKHQNIRIIVTSVRQQASTRAIFHHMGITPEEETLLILKSSVHFRADFGHLTDHILISKGGGINIDDPAELPYHIYKTH
jgi:microcystin degradation protein MlrC